MASFRKVGKNWRAEISRQGIRKSNVFDTKAAAVAWATATEAGIIAGKRGGVPDKTFGELLARYADEVSCTKRGERWERIRIALIQRDDVARVKLVDLSATDFATWRDRRLRSVSAASVRREWNLLSNALNVAMKEWRWLEENPIKLVKRPAPPAARDRRISEDEIERLIFALGYDYNLPPTTVTSRVGAAFLFAIETAMRAGEIANLTWDRVFAEQKYVRVIDGKTAAGTRNVPLSTEALRIIQQLPIDGGLVFGLSTHQIDALFRKAKSRAMIEDLHFHDARHEAITRLAKKLDVLDLARMVGHRDLKMLMIYYNATAEEIAGKLG